MLSDEEHRYRRSLAQADQESRKLNRETMEAFEAGDSLGYTVKQAGYYQRLATLFARTNPQASARARELNLQLMKEAVRLKEDKKDQALSDEDTRTVYQAMARFRAPGGNTPENLAGLMGAVGGTKSKNWRVHAANAAVQDLRKAIEMTPDPQVQDFWRTVLAEVSGEDGAKGGADFERSVRKVAVAKPEAALKMLALPGPVGDVFRKAAFGRPVNHNAFQQTLDAVKAEKPHLTELQAISEAHRITKANQGVDDREKKRDDAAATRQQRDTLKIELSSVERDITSLEREKGSANLTRDPAIVQAEIETKMARRNGLLAQIKALGTAPAPAAPPPVDVPPPAAPSGSSTPAPAAPPVTPKAAAPAPAAVKSKPTATAVTSTEIQASAAQLTRAAMQKRGVTAAQVKAHPGLREEIAQEVRAKLAQPAR